MLSSFFAEWLIDTLCCAIATINSNPNLKAPHTPDLRRLAFRQIRRRRHLHRSRCWYCHWRPLHRRNLFLTLLLLSPSSLVASSPASLCVAAFSASSYSLLAHLLPVCRRLAHLLVKTASNSKSITYGVTLPTDVTNGRLSDHFCQVSPTCSPRAVSIHLWLISAPMLRNWVL